MESDQMKHRSSAGPPAPVDEIKRLTAERDEWKAKAQQEGQVAVELFDVSKGMERERDEWKRGAQEAHHHVRDLQAEVSTLAVQREALREACEEALREISEPGFGVDGYANAVKVSGVLKTALALTLPRAAEIARARIVWARKALTIIKHSVLSFIFGERKPDEAAINAFVDEGNSLFLNVEPPTDEEARCPHCGYTEADKRIRMDHYLCDQKNKKL